jgi:DNA-binding IclR family transcriptional regulator
LTNTAWGSGAAAASPRRVFLSHTSDLGAHTEPGSFVAAAVEAVLRARHAVTDMAYFAARDTSPAAVCVDMVTSRLPMMVAAALKVTLPTTASSLVKV